MDNEVVLHCNEIHRCNQRGGRMLSVFDLLEKGTIDIELAGFALYWISQGASFLVGANPGGAGKTTVMGALLNFVPPDVRLVPATEQEIVNGLTQKNDKKCVYICHEIGAGHWFAYLWSSALQNYFQLLDFGHILATNLHADDIDEAHNQICFENRVPENYFQRINLMFYLHILRGYQRQIEKVYFSTGDKKHQLVYGKSEKINLLHDHINNQNYFQSCVDFLRIHQGKLRTIEETRQSILDFFHTKLKKNVENIS